MSETTQPDEAALRALAEQARQGEWRVASAPPGDWWGEAGPDTCVIGADGYPVCATNDDGIPTVDDVANAAYIAAANPQAALAVLATLADLRARLAARDVELAASYDVRDGHVAVIERLTERLAAAEGERDAAVARWSNRHTSCDAECWANKQHRERQIAAELDSTRGSRAMWKERAQTAEQQRDTARAALAEYGEHKELCGALSGVEGPGPCDCGLDAALASPRTAALPAPAPRRTEVIPTCDSCGETHRPDVMCPPHEVRRGTNNADYQREQRELKARRTESVEGICDLCGKPLPPGEEMFRFHGYSGPCPQEPHR